MKKDRWLFLEHPGQGNPDHPSRLIHCLCWWVAQHTRLPGCQACVPWQLWWTAPPIETRLPPFSGGFVGYSVNISILCFSPYRPPASRSLFSEKKVKWYHSLMISLRNCYILIFIRTPSAQEICFTNKISSAYFSRCHAVPVARGESLLLGIIILTRKE